MAQYTLPHTFTGHGYQVTVNADRSIKVRPGDWLSKYTMAIWGDYTKEHLARFKRMKGSSFREVENKDLILVGETLYVVGDLPGVRDGDIGIPPGERTPGGSLPPTESGGEHTIPADRMVKFIEWLKWFFRVDPEWSIGDTASGDLGFSFFNAQYQQIQVINNPTQKSAWFHAAAFGLTFGFPDDVMPINGSFSPMSFPSEGVILRSPLYSRITLDDFRGGCFSFELGGGILMGGSVSILFFGFMYSPQFIIDLFRNYFYYGDPKLFVMLLQKAAPAGAMVMDGLNMVPPGVGFSIRMGAMYDGPATWGRR
jgi:hypothetical protein